jgi:putative proteasome-type protease
VTYCVGIKLDAGLVFASDSRTNAGLDHISTFRKMMVYERPGDRFMVLLSAGNLSVAQSVREILQVTEMMSEEEGAEPLTIWNAPSMFDAARLLGVAMRRVAERDAASLKQAGLDFNVSMILGGQVKGEAMRMFLVYAAGNFIEATRETPYFQIGEHKYGKPVLDRLVTPESSLEDGTKCALLSLDETMKSNLSVGLPIDLAVYREGTLQSSDIICVDEHNPYYKLIHNTWGEKLRHAFESLEAPVLGEQPSENSLRSGSRRHRPIRKIARYDERIC